MDTNNRRHFGRRLRFPESDGEEASVWPGLHTFADSTNVCFQHPSNIIPISYKPVPKQSPPVCSTLWQLPLNLPLQVQPRTPRVCSFEPVFVLLCVAPEKRTDQHSLQLPNRLRRQWLDFANCGDCHYLLFLCLWWFMLHVWMHTCSSHTHTLFFPFLPVCISCFLSPHANISSFLLSMAPNIKSTIPDVYSKLSGRKSWLHDSKKKPKMMFDSLHAVLLE